MKSIIMLAALVCAVAPIKAESNRQHAQAVVAEKAVCAGKKVKQALSNRKVQIGALTVVVVAVALQRCAVKINEIDNDSYWDFMSTAEKWNPDLNLDDNRKIFFERQPMRRRIAHKLSTLAGWLVY